MEKKNFFAKIDILTQCRHYDLSTWQCPQFLFLIMGGIIGAVSLASYLIGTRYIESPEAIAFIVLVTAIILFIISFIVTRSFEKVAETSRMKSEFIHIVSHQLRSPLSNLKWSIELLMSGRMGKIEKKQIEYFRILKENSNRMQELVNDLLIISKIEQQRLSFKKKEFVLEDLVKKLIKEFGLFSKASNIEIKFFFPKNLPKIFADSLQVGLVIENLLDNAIRYTKGGGKVKIKLEQRKNNFYFEIKDNGVGIPEEDKKYIFQKFFRAENILKYQTLGSGLGLCIGKSIIEKSKGKIGFKSEEGKGSTFWFTLPIK